MTLEHAKKNNKSKIFINKKSNNMKKTILLLLLIFSIISCKENYEAETEYNVETPTMSKNESDKKLIDICKNMDGVLDADIKDDILTLKANISKVEAQKLSDGMLSEIAKYNADIKTVIVCDINMDILGYSGK